MSVGFICRSVSSCLFLSLALTSKKFISSFDHSAVNLIVGWQTLSVSINCFKESFPYSQMKNISSIYLYHVYGSSSMSSKILSSRSVINIIAYGGANVVRITVPLNCFQVSLLIKYSISCAVEWFNWTMVKNAIRCQVFRVSCKLLYNHQLGNYSVNWLYKVVTM